MSFATIRYPTLIKFGWNSLSLVPFELSQAHKEKPLIVTDKNMVDLEIFKDFTNSLEAKGINFSVFSETGGNPYKSHVDLGVKSFHEHNADAIIAIGGGCALDVAKAIALMAHHKGDLFSYEDGLKGALEVTGEIPWIMGIPTTAGTGSEVGGSSVISDDLSHRKVIIWSTRLVPNLVIADPKLLVSLPKGTTAATGIDALTHNMEAFLANSYHPFSDGIALEGIRLIHKSLKKSYHNPEDREARSDLLMASMMGAVAFQKGLGVNHSCAHALSALFDLHHGMANALMMVPCMKFNMESSFDRFVRMGEAISLTGDSKSKANGFISWLEDLKQELEVPKGLRDFSVILSDDLYNKSFEDPCHQSNPRKCTVQDFKKLFAEAY